MKDTVATRHASLVTGGYAEMKPESRIKYHAQITIETVIQELESWKEWSEQYSEALTMDIEERINELKKEIE